MKKTTKYHNDFIVDRLTNSIVNSISGDSFPTEVSLLSKEDIKQVQKKNGWLFNWKEELKLPDREVYKLTIVNNSNIVQGITSLTVRTDNVFLHLIETAPFNKGKGKLYEGVAGNIVAFACRLSFQRGSDGFVSFHSKTNLIDHYVKTLNAIHFGNHLMVIDTGAALRLVDKYFKS
ncbi:MAG: hypothetical protein A3F72_14950 [Bacteroidetes bacterium RIFCSPLOWO2_12_FULL_35_15]|nr:MAG: hypothetical protein A3F72_14950 [Bacteroidetes bacterium RIFCSPLOWO2_12_FULL_35_15]